MLSNFSPVTLQLFINFTFGTRFSGLNSDIASPFFPATLLASGGENCVLCDADS